VLLLEATQALAAADLQAAAAAAAAGVTPEELQAFLNSGGGGGSGSRSSAACSAGAAAAVLVGGLVGVHAAQRRSGRSGSPPRGQLLQRADSGASSDGAGGVGGSPQGGARACRPSSAPLRGHRERSASPAAAHAGASPGALGPASGRVSVYEQRAKLLFELQRAQVGWGAAPSLPGGRVS
jgi:hypothetical protein